MVIMFGYGGMVHGGGLGLHAMFLSGVAGSPATFATAALGTPLPGATISGDHMGLTRFGWLMLPVVG